MNLNAYAKIAPPNSLLLIMDSCAGTVPNSMAGALISFTETCIAVGCKSAADGETEILLGMAVDVTPGPIAAFDGIISTPNRKVSICSVLRKEILAQSVPNTQTRIRIWANDSFEPDRIVVGIG